MKAEFIREPPSDQLLITVKTNEEAEKLSRWHNCILSAKFDYNIRNSPPHSALLIVKESQ